MAVFKFVVSEPKSRKSFQMEVDQGKAVALIGKKIGDDFNGDVIGMGGYVLKITGGTDKDGFPMHPNLKGSGRKKLLLNKPPGFKPAQKGQRKRKMMRGDTVSEDIVQVNVKVMKLGEKPFDQLAPKKEKPKDEGKEEAEEAPKETPKEAPKEAPKEQPKEKPKEEPKEEVKEEPKKEEKPAEKKPEVKTEPAAEQRQPEAEPEQKPEPKPEEKPEEEPKE